MSRANATIIGNVGKVDLKEGKGGSKFLVVSIAVNSSYKNDEGERVEKTDWYSPLVFGKGAEKMAGYLKVGSLVKADCNLSKVKKEDKEEISLVLSNLDILRFPKEDKEPQEEN